MTTNDLHQAFADTLARHAAHHPGRTVAVAFEHLPTRATVSINAHETFHPASTIKVPLLVALHRRAQLGQLDLARQLRIHNGFPSSIDGSLFDVHAIDDSETTLYDRIGQSETLAELARLMIVRSSNLATNLLLEVVSPAEVTADMHALGLYGLLLRNRMMDLKAFDAGRPRRCPTPPSLRESHPSPFAARQSRLQRYISPQRSLVRRISK